MCSIATVPPRAMIIGTNNFTKWDSLGAISVLKEYMPINNLKMASVHTFVRSLANPFNWQSQLQAGPYGNSNSGAFRDKPYGGEHDTDNTLQEFEGFKGDTRGHEWGCLFEHSGATAHCFDF